MTKIAAKSKLVRMRMGSSSRLFSSVDADFRWEGVQFG